MRTDHQIKSDVISELRWEPSVNETHIGVSVKEGIVTLSGHVPTFGEKYGAERAAQRVRGVRAVADELDVRLASDKAKTDEDIAKACVRALRSHALIPDDHLQVLVTGGRVTVEGAVPWRYQRDAVDVALRHIEGVRAMTNSIVVRPPISNDDVKQKIEAAFKRNAIIDASHVDVEIHGDRVTLRGTVRSWAEKAQAQQAAWAAPGVAAVVNDLVVTA